MNVIIHSKKKKLLMNKFPIILKILLILTLAFLINSEVSAAFIADSLEKNISLEINGLLVDETQSKTAKEFYDMFYNQWTIPELAFQYSIIFSEKPMPRFGTLITIKINEQQIFQNFVQPRYERIEEMVELALRKTLLYLENYQQIQEELKVEELDGNGIY